MQLSLTRLPILLLVAQSPPLSAHGEPLPGAPLPGTAPLTLEGDIASQLVDGVDRFLLRKITESVALRERHWKRDFSSAEAYNKSIEPNRRRLSHILGVRDARVPFDAPDYVSTTTQPALVGRGEGYEIYAVRWPVLKDPDPNRATVVVHGEGLLLVPTGGHSVGADFIVLTDADQTPEQAVGLAEGIPVEAQYARRLAELGCRVVVPTLVSREMKPRNGRAVLTNREYLYRSAFELGRQLIGYEVQKALALVDWFAKDAARDGHAAKIGIAGYGDGAMLALCAGALDTRVSVTALSGYFDDRRDIWQQPIDRNVFGLLDQFGDGELFTMIFPRSYLIEFGGGPSVQLPGQGGAPARLEPVDAQRGEAEFERVAKNLEKRQFQPKFGNVFKPTQGQEGKDQIISRAVPYAGAELRLPLPAPKPPRQLSAVDVAQRQARQVDELDLFNQLLLIESPYVREQFMQRLYNAAESKNLAEYEKVAEEYREIFRTQVIGAFDDPLLPPNPRTRKTYDSEKWTGYEVVLDVWPDVIAYGVLLLPKDLKEGEKRPVVVCQHGLEGRPQDIIAGDNPAYHDFAAKLAEQGFITFAPQNLYIFTDRFRTLQRKANPLGKTLFSVIVPQHQQITEWLKTLPNVDPERIAFYGLSYGGKSAMRIPALVKNYCLSICSADFNEWVWKNASTRSPYSYVWGGEYEIFEFDLGSTFNYAEMAALIAPRPFMVERGHFDGVAPDEAVAYEFGKVRHHYAARLNLGDRCELETFVGPHTINGQGTYEFLHKHLRWGQK